MKKLFISCPMRGRTKEAIENSRTQMHKIAEIVFGEELEVIETPLDAVPSTNSTAIYFLGYSISKMSEADYFIGVDWTETFRGCDTERRVANDYGIQCFIVPLYGTSFLKDACEIDRKWYENDAKDCAPVSSL